MKQTKILIIGSYPILKPQHGGQKRAKAIFDFYSKEFEQAKYVGVFHRGQYPDWSEDDLPLGDPKIIAEIDKHPYAGEIISGQAIDRDIHVRSHLAKLLREYNPNIVHLEQPFVYLGLKKLLIELGLSPTIVFGSQNIEYILKKRIFKELKVESRFAGKLIKITKDLEYELSQEADLVVAVNNEDAKNHRDMGAKRCIVAGNGIELVKPQNVDVAYWRNLKKREGIEHILTFVGSGHPPNWEGFLELIGNDTRFLPPGYKIVIAGGVSNYFNKDIKKTNLKFWSSVKTVGILEENRLAALLSVSDIILLPIMTKRGSNLKTAEAILSQKKIVATNNTFHGFEDFVNQPNIYIGNDKNSFKKAILAAIRTPYVHLSASEVELSKRVQWEYCLRPIKDAMIKRTIVKRITGIQRKIKHLAIGVVRHGKRLLS